jgi:hypothetical protein
MTKFDALRAGARECNINASLAATSPALSLGATAEPPPLVFIYRSPTVNPDMHLQTDGSEPVASGVQWHSLNGAGSQRATHTKEVSSWM